MTVEQFLDELCVWAASRPDILAVGLVGSHARRLARPDSDIDVVLIAARPEEYLADAGWTSTFGTVERQQVEPYGQLTSVRVWYSDGREVEFGLTSAGWAALPLDESTQRVVSDGLQVLYERWPLLSRLLPGA